MNRVVQILSGAHALAVNINANSHLAETETYSPKASLKTFSTYPIFAEHTHCKADFTKVYTILETFKAPQ